MALTLVPNCYVILTRIKNALSSGACEVMLKALIAAASGDEPDDLELQYLGKYRKTTTNNNNCVTVYRMTRKLAIVRNCFDGSIKEHLKTWKIHFTTVFNCITSIKAPPLKVSSSEI